MLIKTYCFGNTEVCYKEVQGTVGLAVYPKGAAPASDLPLTSLVQVSFRGDDSKTSYGNGITLQNGVATCLKVVSQEANGEGVVTKLTDGQGNGYTHTLHYDAVSGAFDCFVQYENKTGEPRELELLASLSLGAISADGGTAGLKLYRMVSAWSRECRLKTDDFIALGLEASWANYGIKCEKWGQVGSMPNRGYYPFAAIEGGGVCWAVQWEAPYSWQAEVVTEGKACSLTVGLGDYNYAHWRKTIPAGGVFCTHKAYFAVADNFTDGCAALLSRLDRGLNPPATEETLPILFNEYCTTWGTPSEEKIRALLPYAKKYGAEVFVIDAGWYKPLGRPWENAVGDWKESREYFPHGIKSVVNEINGMGMRAGIWFEFECAANESETYGREELLLKRDGKPITCRNRRFLDLRKEEVTQFLTESLSAFLEREGFGYLKIDYNEAYGIGADGAESLGEGGRQVAEESIRWLDRLRELNGGLVIENCASGGSRIEPLRMSKVSMCSFSDAHECDEIPFVAANISRVVPARQIQIWATLRHGAPDKLVYLVCAGMLGRICLSGDIDALDEEESALLTSGLNFYKNCRELIRYGKITELTCTVQSYRNLQGGQVYVKEYKNSRLVVVHLPAGGEVEIPCYGKLCSIYTNMRYTAENTVRLSGKKHAAAAILFTDSNGTIDNFSHFGYNI